MKDSPRHIHAEQLGQGPRLILLHGWTMRGEVMAPLADALSQDFTCVAPDLPGHGQTSGYSADMEGAVQLLDDLLADGQPTVLVGWSLGALVAWRWSGLHGPGAVRGIVSIDMSPCPLPVPGWHYPMRGQSAEAIRGRADWFRADWQKAAPRLAATVLAKDAPDNLIVPLHEVISGQDPQVMAQFWSSLIETDCRLDLTRLPLPLLAIHGRESQVYAPACARFLASFVTEGECAIIDSTGHAPHLEAPAETARYIRSFSTWAFET